jgi:hypothetical protein
MRQSGWSRVHNKHFSRGHFVGNLEDFLGGCASLAGREGVDVGDDGAELEGVEKGDACGVDDADMFDVVVSENVAVMAGVVVGIVTIGLLVSRISDGSVSDMLFEGCTFSFISFIATIQTSTRIQGVGLGTYF